MMEGSDVYEDLNAPSPVQTGGADSDFPSAAAPATGAATASSVSETESLRKELWSEFQACEDQCEIAAQMMDIMEQEKLTVIPDSLLDIMEFLNTIRPRLVKLTQEGSNGELDEDSFAKSLEINDRVCALLRQFISIERAVGTPSHPRPRVRARAPAPPGAVGSNGAARPSPPRPPEESAAAATSTPATATAAADADASASGSAASVPGVGPSVAVAPPPSPGIEASAVATPLHVPPPAFSPGGTEDLPPPPAYKDAVAPTGGGGGGGGNSPQYSLDDL